MSDSDTDADFQKDRIEHASIRIDYHLGEYLKLINVPPAACASCLAEIRAVLRNYEPS